MTASDLLITVHWPSTRGLVAICFFSDHQDRLVRLFLPPYSPELNPIERVWHITRRQVTHNRYFASTSDLATALTSHFARWDTPNEALRVLCARI